MQDERGYEIPDPDPIARPLHLGIPETLAQKIQRMVRSELSRQAEAEGHESFEEADDFDVGDDPELASPYELSDSNFEERYGQRQDEKPEDKRNERSEAVAAKPGTPEAGNGSDAGNDKGSGTGGGAAK